MQISSIQKSTDQKKIHFFQKKLRIAKVKLEIENFCSALFHREKFVHKDFAFVDSKKLKGEKKYMSGVIHRSHMIFDVSRYIAHVFRKEFPLRSY